MDLEQNQILISLIASAIIGGIIGLEREKIKQVNKSTSAVGIRTDIIISLFGAVSILISKSVGYIAFYISLSGILLFTLINYAYLSFKENKINIKTEVSTIIVFLLGALTMIGPIQTAIEIAILTVGALSLKKILHKAIYNLKYEELIDATKFALIAFIILPFLPNQSYDHIVFPYFFPGASPQILSQFDILNPYKIWLIIVIISGINFLGYILIKILGKNRGIGITGMIGGIYSSTITSLTLAEKSKNLSQIKLPFVAGITLACATSFIKMFILLETLNNELFMRSALSIGIMCLYMFAAGLYILRKEKNTNSEKLDKNKNKYQFETSPFKLSKAIKLGSIIIITLIAANLILSFTDIKFYYILAALMAFFAVDDPVLISTSQIAGKLIPLTEAKNIIITVIFLNLVQKVATVYFFGNKKLVKPLAIVFAGLFLVSTICFLYL